MRFRHFWSGSVALASLNHTCRNLVPTFPQRSPPWLLTAAACGGLRSTPDCRPRRALLHLSYSYASPCGPALLVTQDPFRTFVACELLPSCGVSGSHTGGYSRILHCMVGTTGKRGHCMAVTSEERSGAVGTGLATVAHDGTVLDAWFVSSRLTAQPGRSGTVQLASDEAQVELGERAIVCLKEDARRSVTILAVRTLIESLEAPPVDAYDVYLRLHLLSNRNIRPHAANLTGMFS